MESVRQLNLEFSPTHYTLALDLQRQARTFTGMVTITGMLQKAGNHIPVHAKELQFDQVTIDGREATATFGKNDEVDLTSPEVLAEGEHTVEIHFAGKITDPMHGLYPCYFTLDGKDEELLATQFESHHAREAFPCVDEPAAKATFDLILTTEKDITVIANTPVKTQEEKDGKLVSTFETTPKMSTYLLAWAAGKLGFKEAKTAGGVQVRAYATPDNVGKVDFALDTAVKTLDLYNDYFGLPYPLEKCDMVALPDFSAGAMENWGCITFRESAFFVDERSSAAAKQRVGEVVAHELAHQWFGNLVTMKWWNDLWLNESFATWMASYSQDKLFPDWQLWTQFYNEETAYALDRDTLKSIQSVQQEVQHPDQIRTLFDPAIVYAKGANLVHMVHAYMGDDAFRAGLQAYMKQHAYGNTEAADLWAAWSKASGKDIGTFMTPWISQPGHPIVKVGLNEGKATLHQTRFYTNPEDYKTDKGALWPVPLLAGTQLSQELLTEAEVTIPINESTEPLLLNQGRTGFYVPLYSPDHLRQLAERITGGKMAELDRLGLLNEAYDLAKAGQQSTHQMLELLEAYKAETSEPVWGAIGGALGALRVIINEEEDLKPALQRFTANLARAQYERLGWERTDDEPYFDRLLRPHIIALMGYSEDPEVVAKATQLLADAKNPEDVQGDIRAVVFSINAKLGDDVAFNKMLTWVKDERSPEVRGQLTAGLCAVKQEARVKELVALLKTKHVKLQDIFHWIAYMGRNRYARPFIWQWVKDEWEWITENFGSDGHYTSFPRYIAGGFNTREELESYKEFFMPKIEHPMLSREIKQGIENIEARVLWRERDFAAVKEYLSQIDS